jgi:ribokinase
MPELVCIGNLTVDETVQPDGTHAISAGGDAVFAALAARRYLGTVTLLAPLGTDLPDELERAIRLIGAVPEDLPHRELPTVRNIVRYDATGGRTWELVEGDDHFDRMSVYPRDVPASALAADGILVSAMSLGSQLALGPWLRAHSDALIYLDLQEDYLAEVDALLELIADCDVFIPSEIEAIALAGTTDVEAAARFFLSCGPSTVVIKRAAEGCLVLSDAAEIATVVPAVTVQAVDSTGAGDAFCGAFAAVHLLTGDAVEAARAGTAAAAIAISDFGVTALLTGAST